MGQTYKKWCGSDESIILYKHPSICVILLGDSNKKTDEFIFLFDESFFLILDSCFWRKLYCILLFSGNYWIIQLLVELFSDKLSLFDSLWRRDWWYIFDTNLRIYIFWWDLFFSSSINISHSVWITFFLEYFSFLFPQTFLHINSISVFWALNLLSPSILFPSSQLFLFWMLWKLVTVNNLKHVMCHGQQLREEQVKKHSLGKLFSLSQNLLSISPNILMRNRKRIKKSWVSQ